MATRKRTRLDGNNDDLRDLLSMLTVLIGSRVERDALGLNASDDEADAVIASIKDQLASVIQRRAEEQGRPRVLQWAANLAKVYARAPESRRDASWSSYEARVRSALFPPGDYDEQKLTGGFIHKKGMKVSSGFLTRGEVRTLRGPVEAGRIVAAQVANRTEGTLRNWTNTGVEPADTETSLPFENVTFYGTDVHFPDAVADVVSLLAIDDVNPSGYVKELRSYPSGDSVDGFLADALQFDDSDHQLGDEPDDDE